MQAAPSSRYVVVAALAGLVAGALATMAITDRADPATSDPEATSALDLRDDDGWNLVDLTHALSPDSLY